MAVLTAMQTKAPDKAKTGKDPVKLLRDILALDLAQCEIQLCLAALAEGNRPHFQRVQITENVCAEFRGIVKRVLDKKRADHDGEDLVLKAYDPQAKLDGHEAEYLTLDDHEQIHGQLADLGDVATLELFKAEDAFVQKLKFYVISLHPAEGQPVFFFRIYTPKKELSRSLMFALVMRDGNFDRVGDKMFLFDQYIDCMARDGVMFIFNKDRFQKIFRFYELVMKTARETLAVIERKVPIDDFRAFAAACEGHMLKLLKLKNISNKPYLEKMTISQLKKVIKAFNLPIETVGRGKDEKIHFDASDKWAILRLLDDDYLESILTGNKYETNSKRVM